METSTGSGPLTGYIGLTLTPVPCILDIIIRGSKSSILQRYTLFLVDDMYTFHFLSPAFHLRRESKCKLHLSRLTPLAQGRFDISYTRENIGKWGTAEIIFDASGYGESFLRREISE